MGHADEAPYDAIHVGAACPQLPQTVRLQNFLFSVLIMRFG